MPLAYFFLNESMTKLKVLALIGAFFGVFILSLNKNEDEHGNHEYYYVGISLLCISSLSGAGVGVMLRILSSNLHPTLSPVWYSITTLFSVALFLTFYPSVYNLPEYDIVSCLWFIVSGILVYIGINFISLASKYAEASIIAPIQYISTFILSVFDIVVFNYKFNLTDILGFIVILV